jgi:hypothetical protein
MKAPVPDPAAIGFRAKTGRSIAIALAGSVTEPELIWRQEVSLIDPNVPETAQPYHEVMELPWSEAIVAAKPFVAAIEAVASKMLKNMIAELQSKTLTLHKIGIVGSLDRNLVKLGNPHIRAHAAEGMLFRQVLERAAAAHGISWRTFSEQTLTQSALSELGPKSASYVKELGSRIGPPWRGDEKAASTAAWLALSR